MCIRDRDHFCIRHQVNSELENYFEKVYIACKEKQDLKAIGNLYHLLDYVKNSKQDSFIPLLSQSEVHYNEPVSYTHLDVYKRQLFNNSSCVPNPCTFPFSMTMIRSAF